MSLFGKKKGGGGGGGGGGGAKENQHINQAQLWTSDQTFNKLLKVRSIISGAFLSVLEPYYPLK